MVLDPFTIFAQIFNFLVLMVLLRRFLYGPIVRTMDERELRISRDMDEAARRGKEAAEQATALHAERQDLEDHRGELLSQAQEDAERLRKGLIKDAREEVETRRVHWLQAVEREKESFLGNLRERSGQQVYEISRRVLTDLANLDLEQHIIDTFIKNLGKIDETDLGAVNAQFMQWKRMEAEEPEEEPPAAPQAVLTSAFDIDTESRRRLTDAVHQRLGSDIELDFEVTPELICGIELRTQGYKAAWSLQNYLESLDENLSLAFASHEEEPVDE